MAGLGIVTSSLSFYCLFSKLGWVMHVTETRRAAVPLTLLVEVRVTQDPGLESAQVLGGCAVITARCDNSTLLVREQQPCFPTVLAAGRGAAILWWLCNWL